MNRFKKLAAPVAGIALIAAGLASAAATDPIPNPLPNAVAGNVIKASDINDIATAVGILDERTDTIMGDISVNVDGNVGIGTSDIGTVKLNVQDHGIAGESKKIALFGGKGAWNPGDYEELGVGFNGIRSVYTPGAGWDLALTAGVSETFRSGNQPEIMRISGNGNVGIGTANPANHANQRSLTVNGPSVGRVDLWANGTGGGAIFGTASKLSLAGNFGSLMEFSTNGEMRIEIADTGAIKIPGLGGSGNAYACVNDSGILYRSATACN